MAGIGSMDLCTQTYREVGEIKVELRFLREDLMELKSRRKGWLSRLSPLQVAQAVFGMIVLGMVLAKKIALGEAIPLLGAIGKMGG